MRAFNDGRWLETEVKLADGGNLISWGFVLGQFKTTTVLRINENGEWTELGELIIGDRPPLSALGRKRLTSRIRVRTQPPIIVLNEPQPGALVIQRCGRTGQSFGLVAMPMMWALAPISVTSFSSARTVAINCSCCLAVADSGTVQSGPSIALSVGFGNPPSISSIFSSSG